jgi:Fe2+ or Zn2+ uptake regulation protein
MSSHDDDIAAALKGQGIRVTQARRSVYQALSASNEPLSASHLDEALRAGGISIDLVTVYRTLDTLERCGLITRVDRLHEGWRYAIRQKEHHHSITCSACGSSAPLEACDLQRIESALAARTGFADVHHSLQFYGVCPQCQG